MEENNFELMLDLIEGVNESRLGRNENNPIKVESTVILYELFEFTLLKVISQKMDTTSSMDVKKEELFVKNISTDEEFKMHIEYAKTIKYD